MSTKEKLAVCIDTSVLYRVIVQNPADNSLKHLEQLDQIRQAGLIALLVPEVVSLELAGLLSTLEDNINSDIKRFKAKIGDVTYDKLLSHEITRDIKQDLLTRLDSWSGERLADCYKRERAVKAIMERGDLIRYNLDIAHKAKRRLIAGQFPQSTGKRDQDAAIIESVEAVTDIDKVLFCSLDHNGFAVEIDGRHAISPALCVSKWIYYDSVTLLVEALESDKELGAFLTAEEIARGFVEQKRQNEEAQRRQKELNRRVMRLMRLFDTRERARKAGYAHTAMRHLRQQGFISEYMDKPDEEIAAMEAELGIVDEENT